MPLEPIDELHEQCLLTREQLRVAFTRARVEVSIWEPRPCPSTWGKKP